jgi:small conductance mechanosensitive channel
MNAQLTSISRMQGKLLDLAIQYGPKVVVALVILVAGFYVGGWVKERLERRLARMDLERPVIELLARLTGVLTFGLFAVLALENLGIELLPLIAGLSVVGAGIALATQGVLSNLVAGLSILFAKPFRVGEYISIANEEGQIDHISLFSTTLTHPDRSRIVIPNRKIVGEILHNFGDTRQLDLAVNVAYDTDLGAALALIGEILRRNPRVLADPAPIVRTLELGQWAVKIAVRPWVRISDYGPAADELNRELLESLRSRGIVVPLPQSEVRLLGNPRER